MLLAEKLRTVTFPSKDGLQITADILQGPDAEAPWLVLCHQAGWSRGEYRETMPWLVSLGYNCIAVDLRSGGAVNGVQNATHRRAVAKGLPTTYLDAMPDMEAAIAYVRQQFHPSRLILVGSSYSASLALLYAAMHPNELDGVLAFSPGEYFVRFGKPADFVAQYVPKIQCPVLITCAYREKSFCEHFRKVVKKGQAVEFFVPERDGAHGSRALWKQFPQASAYRQAVQRFLIRYFPVRGTKDR